MKVDESKLPKLLKLVSFFVAIICFYNFFLRADS